MESNRFNFAAQLTKGYIQIAYISAPRSKILSDHEKKCSSCGIRLVRKTETTFPCPKCGNAVIGRCMNCRDQSVKYKCPECGFIGP
ncbi:MAG: DUF1610 domain-containing protein [Thermoplasmata archaeon]|nr:DUF1610 domain-containing protein [Thermoplasmata archaeon]